MTEQSSIWPEFDTGPKEHMHAVGVITTTFNDFEANLYDLYCHKAQQKGMPLKIYSHIYLGEGEHKQMELLRLMYTEWEDDKHVTTTIQNSISYFDWCSNSRNMIAHAQHYPAPFFAPKDKLHIMKRRSKKSIEHGYASFDVGLLRNIADKIKTGAVQSSTVWIYLRIRDIGIKNLHSAYKQYENVPLPHMLEIPEALSLKAIPHDE